MNPYICPRCQNQDPIQIGFRQGQPYCRACVAFAIQPCVPHKRQPIRVPLQLDYELTSSQQRLSDQLIQAYHHHQSVMIDAVTGSGKTELVFSLIQTALADGKHIGFVIPRRDVVLELAPRFQKVFSTIKITTVIGGHHDELEGDLVMLTTHQIFRYERYFDVLIFDEVDAFPYVNNPLLKAMVHRASQGIIVYMSATFSIPLLDEFRKTGGVVLHLHQRFHGHPLPQITILRRPYFTKWMTLIACLEQFQSQQQPVFVFVPTIAVGKILKRWCRLFFKKVLFVYAANEHRHRMIEDYKRKPQSILITTSILERGITLDNLQVIIFYADHPVWTSAALIQMAGRVGRKQSSPQGHIYALVDRNTRALQDAWDSIHRANTSL